MITDWKKRLLEKTIDPVLLEEKVEDIKSKKKTVALLNGSFDLLHAGHLHIIFEASKQADILIVALNTDSSIKRYKSPERPIIPLEERLQMVAALEFVDYVTWFNETTPIRLIKTIRPNVHVNGSDYGSECVEASVVEKIGARLHIVSRLPGNSTTDILKKVQSLRSLCV